MSSEPRSPLSHIKSPKEYRDHLNVERIDREYRKLAELDALETQSGFALKESVLETANKDSLWATFPQFVWPAREKISALPQGNGGYFDSKARGVGFQRIKSYLIFCAATLADGSEHEMMLIHFVPLDPNDWGDMGGFIPGSEIASIRKSIYQLPGKLIATAAGLLGPEPGDRGTLGEPGVCLIASTAEGDRYLVQGPRGMASPVFFVCHDVHGPDLLEHTGKTDIPDGRQDRLKSNRIKRQEPVNAIARLPQGFQVQNPLELKHGVVNYRRRN